MNKTQPKHSSFTHDHFHSPSSMISTSFTSKIEINGTT